MDFLQGSHLSFSQVAQCGLNCVRMTGTNMHLRDSVFLRDTPARLFLHGTTDVIVGTVTGKTSAAVLQ